jgi:23S rRNA pseudouridine1911/1915/1917 synthase
VDKPINQIRVNVLSEKEGLRLDKFLAELPEIPSRSYAEKLNAHGKIRVNNEIQKTSYQVQTGDEIEIVLPQPEKSELLPYKFPLDIFFEDEEVLVVNKPAGLVVHPSAGHHNDTLVNALLAHTQDLSAGFLENRPGIVHRIDKDTSGLLVVAKSNRAHAHLAEQFQSKSVYRKYWAIVFGKPRPESGTIKKAIARHPVHRKIFSVVEEGGKEAITEYETIADHLCGLSLVHLKLQTGRTHQIRVHMKDLGHPIVADWAYANKRRVNSINSEAVRKVVKNLSRFALHAAELRFTHPKREETMAFKAPWPEELLSLTQLFED